MRSKNIWLPTLALLAIACQPPPAPEEDAAVDDADVRDAGPPDAGGPDAGPRDGGDVPSDGSTTERRTYVVASLGMPITPEKAESFGIDLDGDGDVDNQMGDALSELPLHLRFRLLGNSIIDRGIAIVLIELVAPSLWTTDSARARVLEGTDPVPAPCFAPDEVACRHHLDGSGAFTVVPPAPPSMAATISSSELDAGPGSMSVPLAVGDTPVWVPLVGARVLATIEDREDGRLIGGRLVGAVRAADVDALVIPALLGTIAETVALDCPGGVCRNGTSGEALIVTYDDDTDGTITAAELRAHPATALGPDVDLLDAAGAPGTDGVPDSISVGLRFTAHPATFP